MAAEFPPLLSFILDHMDDAVFIVEEDQSIVFYNQAAEALTGVPRAEAVGESCKLVFGDENDQAYCVFQELRDSAAEDAGARTTIRHRDGHSLPAHLHMRRIPAQVAGRPLMMGVIRDLSVLERLSAQVADRYRFEDILSRAPQMQTVFTMIRSIADMEVNVLIQGESGTGKELVARAIHELSGRRDGPFHAVNCGALTRELLESELFGHERGAFTGAIKAKPGRLELAAGGTLFLDEIADMPPSLQVKLLRVLQERTFERVGGTKSIKMDARVISATNVDLKQAVAEGKFRQDLFFRVNVVPIELPPLRERAGDVELLAGHYLRLVSERTGRGPKRLSEDALRVMMDYPWPGNVRELINAVEYAVAVSQGEFIRPDDLPRHLIEAPAVVLPSPASATFPTTPPAPPPSLKSDEREFIRQALIDHAFHREATAKALGMSRSTLWRKMRELGLVAAH
ncbi:MAG: sigma 54-interacting transcriptional regulator [Deltaproteobacteria bacterium]|nr:sigma 54-interacting transcriptional regulator [Deltaproteobacteria bacterium]MCB9487364.1 sigma 54-interacting transcriptional regulator [Deltaproteobacteria bacterium]